MSPRIELKRMPVARRTLADWPIAALAIAVFGLAALAVKFALLGH